MKPDTEGEQFPSPGLHVTVLEMVNNKSFAAGLPELAAGSRDLPQTLKNKHHKPPPSKQNQLKIHLIPTAAKPSSQKPRVDAFIP